MRALCLGIMAVGLAAGASARDREPRADASFVSYATTPCYGTCPVYSVTVYADGRGAFHGARFTAVTGDRIFRVTPAQYAEFKRRLAPFRPSRPGPEAPCTSTTTDLPTINLRWRDPGRDVKRSIYLGCDAARNADSYAALRKATDVLPIRAWIGKR